MPWARQRSRKAAMTSAGYSAPPGLLGETSAMARVLEVMREAASVASGIRPAPVGRGTVTTPVMSSHILWLKYHGVGRITSSPGPASVAMTAVKA